MGLMDRLRETGLRPVDSVLRNLRDMLNTRQGHALIAPNYGMPDIVEFVHAPDAVEAVRRAISKSIRDYEPRLNSVQVTLIPPEENELRVRFQITASLNADPARATVRFETAVEASGRILVKG